MKCIGRSGGKSVCATSAYISGGVVTCNHTGMVFDYSKRSDVVVNGILAPKGAPAWALIPQSLWNMVEDNEDKYAHERFRGDSKDPNKKAKSLAARAVQLATCNTGHDANYALPLGLTIAQQQDLSERIIHEAYVARGLIVQYAIHNDEHNPHLHLLSTTRALIDGVFSKKRVTFNRQQLTKHREHLASITNAWCVENNINYRADARSYAAQGIDVEPTHHIGAKAYHKHKEKSRIWLENQDIQARNIACLMKDPSQIIKLVAQRKPVFTSQDLAREVFKRVGGHMELFHTLCDMLDVNHGQDMETLCETSTHGPLFSAVGGGLYNESTPSPKDTVSNDSTPQDTAEPTLTSQETQAPTHTSKDTADTTLTSYDGDDMDTHQPPEQRTNRPQRFTRKQRDNTQTKQKQSYHQQSYRPLNNNGGLQHWVKSLFKSLVDANQPLPRKAIARWEGLSSTQMDVYKTMYHLTFAANLNKAPDSKEGEGCIKGALDDPRLVSYVAHALERFAHNIGCDLRHNKVYTSHETYQMEADITSSLDALMETKDRGVILSFFEGPGLTRKRQDACIDNEVKRCGFDYSPQQREAIYHLAAKDRIKVLTGRAGSGKTTVLKPYVAACLQVGKKPIGVAFQGKVSELLSKELHIPSFTIDQLIAGWNDLQKLEKGLFRLHGKARNIALKKIKKLKTYTLTKDHVVILDEANMVAGNLLRPLLHNVETSGASIRIVQDQAQIKAFQGGDISRLIEEKVGSFELTEVFRQKTPWMREASKALNDHDMASGLNLYHDHGNVAFLETASDARSALIEAYVQTRTNKPQASRMALAFTNKDTDAINDGIRTRLKEEGTLKTDQSILCQKQEMLIGETIRFTQNTHSDFHIKNVTQPHGGALENVTSTPHHAHSNPPATKGVKNGTIGCIQSIDANTKTLTVALQDGRHVAFSLKDYDHLTYGYAMTSNKAEGQTFDHTFGLVGQGMSANKTLVFATRHKEDLRVFVPKTIAPNINALIHLSGKAEYRALISDYTTDTPAKKLMRSYLDAATQASNLWGTITRESGDDPFYHPLMEDFRTAKENRAALAKEVLHVWDQTRPLSNQVGLSKSTLEVQAGLKERPLNIIEQEALERVDAYKVMASKVREMKASHKKGNPAKTTVTQESRAGETEGLIKATTQRNALAFDMAANPNLHKRFFRVKNDEHHMQSTSGTQGDKHRHTFSQAMVHANQHTQEGLDQLWIQNLSKEEGSAYQALVDFKALSKTCARLVIESKQRQTRGANVIQGRAVTQDRAVIQDHTKTLQLNIRERDFKAYTIIANVERHDHLMQRAGVDEAKLLQYAVLGELRQHILHYSQAATVDVKRERSHQILSFTKTQEGHVDKRALAILREYNLDLNRLRFEAAHHTQYKETGHTRFKTVDALQQAFTTLYPAGHSEGHPADYLIDNDDSAHSKEGGPFNEVMHGRGEGTQANHSINEQQPQTKVLQRSTTGLTSSLPSHASNATDTTTSQSHAAQPTTTQPHIDVQLVEEALLKDMAAFAYHVFESEGFTYNKMASSPDQRRYGNKGHIALNIKTGSWIDHKDPQMCGGPLSLLTKLKGMAFKDAIMHATHWTGIDTRNPQFHLQEGKSNKPRAHNQDDTNDQEISNKVQRAKLLHQKGTPIQETLAERYLIEHRKVTAPLVSDVTYLKAQQGNTKSHQSLMVSARNNAGEVTAVQIIALNPVTGQKAAIETPKRSHGLIKGSFVTVQHDTSVDADSFNEKTNISVGGTPINTPPHMSDSTTNTNTTDTSNPYPSTPHENSQPATTPTTTPFLFATEGVETALSIASCHVRGRIVATLGLANMKRLAPAKDTTIILCADHDKPDSQAERTLDSATEHLRDKGYTVHVIKPPTLGHDFNDVLKEGGIKAIHRIMVDQLPELHYAAIDYGAHNLSQTNHAPEVMAEYKLMRAYMIERGLEPATFDQYFGFDGKGAVSMYRQYLIHDNVYKAFKDSHDPLHQKKAYDVIHTFMVQTNKDTKTFNNHYQQNPRQALLAQKERLKDDKAFQLYRAPDLAKEDYAKHQRQAQEDTKELTSYNQGTWHKDPATSHTREVRKQELIEKVRWNPYAQIYLKENHFFALDDKIMYHMEAHHISHCIEMLHAHSGCHPSVEIKEHIEKLFRLASEDNHILQSMAHTHPDIHAAIVTWHTHEEHLENERRHVRGFDMDR